MAGKGLDLRDERKRLAPRSEPQASGGGGKGLDLRDERKRLAPRSEPQASGGGGKGLDLRDERKRLAPRSEPQASGGGETVPEAASERPDEAAHWRGRIALATAGLAFLCASGAWWLEQRKGSPDAFETWGLPLIALASAAVAALRRTRLGRPLHLGLLLACVAVLLERIHTVLREELPGVEPLVDAYEVIGWFPLPYLFSFVLLPTRRALCFCIVLIGAACAVVWGAVAERPALAARTDMLEVFLSNVGCVFFIYTLSSLKERWAAAESTAATLRRLAETDHLTGIPNRREVTARAEREIQRSLRYRGPLALLLFDLDGFKAVNDGFGHEAGDRALRRVAAVLLRTLRSTDVCGRWGGEEFLVALPGVGVEGGADAAERLRLAIEADRPAGEPPLTASFGVTGFVRGDSLESLVRRADGALYEAKRRGRNRVAVTPAPSPAIEVA